MGFHVGPHSKGYQVTMIYSKEKTYGTQLLEMMPMCYCNFVFISFWFDCVFFEWLNPLILFRNITKTPLAHLTNVPSKSTKIHDEVAPPPPRLPWCIKPWLMRLLSRPFPFGLAMVLSWFGEIHTVVAKMRMLLGQNLKVSKMSWSLFYFDPCLLSWLIVVKHGDFPNSQSIPTALIRMPS